MTCGLKVQQQTAVVVEPEGAEIEPAQDRHRREPPLELEPRAQQLPQRRLRGLAQRRRARQCDRLAHQASTSVMWMYATLNRPLSGTMHSTVSPGAARPSRRKSSSMIMIEAQPVLPLVYRFVNHFS
jgi:hypothetical protein